MIIFLRPFLGYTNIDIRKKLKIAKRGGEIEKWNKNKEHLEIMDDNRMPKWRLFKEIMKRPNLC